MIISKYTMKTSIRLLCGFRSEGGSKTKCLTQAWRISKSLYEMRPKNIIVPPPLRGEWEMKDLNRTTAMIKQKIIYPSTALKPCGHPCQYFLFIQNAPKLIMENFEKNQNTHFKASRIKPSFQQDLGFPYSQYSQHLLQHISMGIIALQELVSTTSC